MKLLTFAWTSHLKTIMLKGFKRPDLKQLLCLAAKESYIIFNVLLYRQIDDIAIGPSLGPSLASEFLSYHKNWLNNCPQGLQPVFYRRYVNIFILFRSEDYLNYFQDFLNSWHMNVIFHRKRKRANCPSSMLKLCTNKVNVQPKFIENLILVVYIVTSKAFYLLFIIWYGI